VQKLGLKEKPIIPRYDRASAMETTKNEWEHDTSKKKKAKTNQNQKKKQMT